MSGSNYPNSTVVEIFVTIGGKQYQGSGTLITPDEVLTASHVLFSTSAGTASNITVIVPSANANGPNTNVGVISEHYNKVGDLNDLIANEQSQNDYGVIRLSQSFLANGTMQVVPNYPGGMLTEAGYPGSGNNTLSSSQGNFIKDPNYTLLDGPALGPGSSGGPLYSAGATDSSLVGLVSSYDPNTGQGYDVQITSTVLAKIEGWVAADEGTTEADAIAAPSAATIVADLPTLDQEVSSGSLAPESVPVRTFTGLAILNLTADQVGPELNGLVALATPFAIESPSKAASLYAPGIQSLDLGGGTRVAGIQFAEGRLIYAASDPAAEIARLYYAGLGRPADQQGLTSWTGYLRDSGGSELTVAQAFLGSGEYAGDYGTPSDGQFVADIYQNALGRAPDTAGFQSWTAYLAGGGSRASLTLAFANSAEAISDQTPTLQGGIWNLDGAAPEVYKLYEAALGRAPDVGSFIGWTSAIDGGLSLIQVANDFLTSIEGLALYGNASPEQFVTTLYQFALGRTPQNGEENGYVAGVQSGALSKAQVLLSVANSAEAASRTDGAIYGGTGIKFV